MAQQELVSQAEFARRMGVSRAAVSQWKANNVLEASAFTNPDKTGKLILDVAGSQVRKNRDIGQSLGNGIDTGADAPATETQTQVDPESGPVSGSQIGKQDTSVEGLLKAARLEDSLRKNRMAAAEEAKLQGQLMDARDARAEMARIAGMMMQIFEGALPDFANAMAERFKIPQRDVVHVLRAEFRAVRSQAAKKARENSEMVSQTSVSSIEDVD